MRFSIPQIKMKLSHGQVTGQRMIIVVFICTNMHVWR